MDLKNLTSEEREFYRRAQQKARENVDWFEFEDFAFGMRSPIFSKRRSHLDVLQHPLYTALREMWLDLGVRQGMVAESKSDGTRRKTTRRRPAAHKRNAAKKRHVAAAHSPADKRLPKG